MVLRDASGRVLTVHKRDTKRFMLPGGKPPSRTSRRPVWRSMSAPKKNLTWSHLRLEQTGEDGPVHAPAANKHRLEAKATIFLRIHLPLRQRPRQKLRNFASLILSGQCYLPSTLFC